MNVRVADGKLKMVLRKPFGKVMGARDAARLIMHMRGRAKGRVVSVGDICSLGLIDEGAIPTISICDGKSLRKKLGAHITRKIRRRYRKVYCVRNDAGTISESAMLAIESALAGNTQCYIHVDGEEDMLALAAIIKCRRGDVVVYGQPGEGLVYIKVGPAVKKRARAIFNRMKTIKS
ncbi:MAG: GTP-dependent dephospho-CoA kinase family protein [Candidatus Micrarchaeota archaeon]|nr:GTP-dependent dephospho-CoA kinase family protein [Candidatus Micrarchaeota archaeon]